MPRETGWLQRVLDDNKREVDTWPAYKRNPPVPRKKPSVSVFFKTIEKLGKHVHRLDAINYDVVTDAEWDEIFRTERILNRIRPKHASRNNNE